MPAMESEANREAGRSAKMIAAALVLVLVLLAALLLPLRRGIWLPDLVPGQSSLRDEKSIAAIFRGAKAASLPAAVAARPGKSFFNDMRLIEIFPESKENVVSFISAIAHGQLRPSLAIAP